MINYFSPNLFANTVPDSKVHGANMGPIWGQQYPGGPHVGPLNFVIWGNMCLIRMTYVYQWIHLSKWEQNAATKVDWMPN